MIRNPSDPAASFNDLLIQYDEALAESPDASIKCSVATGATLQGSGLTERFERILTCLHVFEQDRRTQIDSVDDQSFGERMKSDAGSASAIKLNGDESFEQELTQPPPRRIGRFRLLRRLGSGGFGVVFLAEDPTLKRFVALKIPRPETLATPDLQRRFVFESQVAARLTHPHLVSIFEAGQVGPVSYQVTAYCAGGNLASWLRASEPSIVSSGGNQSLPIDETLLPLSLQRQLPIHVAVELLIGLAEGVQHAHEHGILHRDLKPANVLLQPKGDWSSGVGSMLVGAVSLESLCIKFQPMVGDFGLAKVFDDAQGSSHGPIGEQSSSPHVTSAAGTPQYMAPEQIGGQVSKIGPKTDVYGLGAILYEVLAGMPVFGRDTIERLSTRIETELPTPLRQLRGDIPLDLEAICLKCLDKSPSKRYATAQGLVDDLRSFQKSEPVAARPWPWHEQFFKWTSRRPAVAALVLFSAVLTMGLIGFGAWHLHQLDTANERLRSTVEDLKTQTEAATLARRQADTQSELAREQRRTAERHSQQAQDLEWIARQREYAGGMVTASHFLSEGRIGEANESLRSFRPVEQPLTDFDIDESTQGGHAESDDIAQRNDVRDFVWRYLSAQSGHLRLLRGHDNEIRAAQLTPDGRTCYSVSTDNTIRRWDTDRGQLMETWSLGAEAATEFVARFDRSVSRAVIRRRFPSRNIEEVIIWDLHNGHVIQRKEFPLLAVESIAISANGLLVAIGEGGDSHGIPAVLLWNSESGEMTSTVMPASASPEFKFFGHAALAFSPDGRQLAIGGQYAKDKGPWYHQLWRATLEFTKASDAALLSSTPRLVNCELINPLFPALEHEIVYSADGQRIALSANQPSIVQVWDVKQKTLVATVSDLPAPVDCLAINESGTRMVMGIENPERTANGQPESATNPAVSVSRNELSLWDISENKRSKLPFAAQQCLRSISQFRSNPLDTNFERVGSGLNDVRSDETFVIGDSGGVISLWTPESVAPHRDLQGHQPLEAWGLAFSPDSKRLYSVGDDASLRVWDMATLAESAVGKKHIQLTSCVAVSADGQWVATGSYDDRVILWKTDSLEPHAVLEGHTDDIKTLAFSPDSRILATAARDRLIRLWSVPDGQLIKAFAPDDMITRGIAFAAGDTIVKGDAAGHIATAGINLATEVIRDEGQEVHCLALVPGGLRWPSTTASGTAISREETPLIQTVGSGQLLLVGCKRGRFELIHLPTRAVWFALSYPGTDIRTVAFSPDGQTFAVAGDDKTVHLWHTATRQEILTFADLPAEVNQVAFSPDGQMLAAALHNGTIRIWRAPAR